MNSYKNIYNKFYPYFTRYIISWKSKNLSGFSVGNMRTQWNPTLNNSNTKINFLETNLNQIY